jgi:hypothetical protein
VVSVPFILFFYKGFADNNLLAVSNDELGYNYCCESATPLGVFGSFILFAVTVLSWDSKLLLVLNSSGVIEAGQHSAGESVLNFTRLDRAFESPDFNEADRGRAMMGRIGVSAVSGGDDMTLRALETGEMIAGLGELTMLASTLTSSMHGRILLVGLISSEYVLDTRSGVRFPEERALA